jgi:penicillin-binding protein 1C
LKFSSKNRSFFLMGASVFMVMAIGLVGLRFFSKPILADTSFSKLVYSADGVLLRITTSGDQKFRFPITLSDVSPDYIHELIKKEDRYFYYHFGFNPWSLLQAINETYLQKKRRRGASTITMQLARLMSITGSQTIFGKSKQLCFAVYLELTHSKKEILEAYLTLTPYGRNIESLGAASFMYFGKSPQRLEPFERRRLLDLPQNPNAKTNSMVLQPLPFKAPHFTDRLLALGRGERAERFKINSTLNYKLQKKIERIVGSYLNSKKQFGVNNAAVVVARISTGEILSYMGSSDYFDVGISGQVNGANSRRSPGSILKPFLYARAIEEGLIHPQTLLKDLPTSFGLYDPENFDRSFRGPLSATLSLVESRNIPAVQLLKDTTHFTTMLRHFGIAQMHTDEFYGLGAAIGGVEISLEEAIALYQQLSHDNQIPKLVFSSRPLAEVSFSNLSPYLSKESRFLAAQMLTANKMNQTLDLLRAADSKVAWKTGTSYGFRDAWTAGLSDDFVVAVWLGNFSGEFNPFFKGRELAAPLFFQIINQVKSWEKTRAFSLAQNNRASKWYYPAQLNVSEVEVCSLSGGMATENCPHRRKTWFIPGKSPIHECSVHQKIWINSGTNKRVCPSQLSRHSAKFTAKIFEVWPSDLFSLFRRAGLFFKLPPDFEHDCDTMNAQLSNLQIVLPRKGIIQTISLKNPLNIFFKATADSSVKKLDWFVDNEHVGSSRPEDNLKWNPKSGRFMVKVVDDRGGVVSQSLVVETVR